MTSKACFTQNNIFLLIKGTDLNGGPKRLRMTANACTLLHMTVKNDCEN